MFGIVALVVAGGLAVLAGVVARKPDSFRVRRATAINAPAEQIFPLLNDFKRWTEWSPWENIDPNLKRTYGGSAAGVGATYTWEGNNKAGAGTMEITESSSPSRLAIKLDFTKPFKSHNKTEFTLAPKGGSTEVIWDMVGPNMFMNKVMGVFINMDQMVGKDFEKGLAKLKTISERSGSKSSQPA